MLYRCHCNRGPPERVRNRTEHRRIGLLLGKVTQRGENQNRNCQEQKQQAQLVIRLFERITQRLQPSRVTRQFEDA